MIILNYSLENSDLHIFEVRSGTEKLLCSFGGVMFSCFFFYVLDGFALIPTFDGTVTPSSLFRLSLFFYLEVASHRKSNPVPEMMGQSYSLGSGFRVAAAHSQK